MSAGYWFVPWTSQSQQSTDGTSTRCGAMMPTRGSGTGALVRLPPVPIRRCVHLDVQGKQRRCEHRGHRYGNPPPMDPAQLRAKPLRHRSRRGTRANTRLRATCMLYETCRVGNLWGWVRGPRGFLRILDPHRHGPVHAQATRLGLTALSKHPLTMTGCPNSTAAP